MSTEKRLVLFLLLSVASMYGMQILLDQMGLLPEPPERAPVVAKAEADAKAKDEASSEDASVDAETAPAAPGEDAPPAEAVTEAPAPEGDQAPEIVLAEPGELTLGSTDPNSPYHLEVLLDQHGAGIARMRSSRYEAEIQEGQPRGRPLDLIREQRRPLAPPSFALNLTLEQDGRDEGEIDGLKDALALLDGPLKLHSRVWEVVRDDQGRAVRPVQGEIGNGGEAVEGQELVFRANVEAGETTLIVKKTYRLWPGRDGLELRLDVESPDQDATLRYHLLGPHGLPIEGEWYTGTFRDVFFGLLAQDGIEVATTSAYDVFKYARPGFEQERFTTPLSFAGVENQYFAVFAQPVPIPKSAEDTTIQEATPVPIANPGEDWQKADVSMVLESKPFEVGPNQAFSQTYRIFAGPKTVEALAFPYEGAELANYRKGFQLWVVGDMGASFMSKYVIRPLLSRTYAVTEWVAGLFGGTRGNWGIAIILLTMVVRLALFPLGRKQAKAAKKMQELQPMMMELKEKYKDEKEKLTQETFALYRQYGVNPLGGCLPALVQLPVLIGLWQTLNSSVVLRHSSFLWIDNLAAPDQLFKLPFELPLISGFLGPYFNLLPIIVVVLMLIQTKLFSPPATTPEAEQQQKMMKFMMIFMAFIFYKVPAGLGIYFITSSLWQIGERLMLPKVTLVPKTPQAEAATTGGGRRNEGGPGATGHGAKPRPKPGAGEGNGAGGKSGWLADLRAKAQKIINDAEKQRTVRNAAQGGGKPDRDRDRDRDRNRPRPRPGRKP